MRTSRSRTLYYLSLAGLALLALRPVAPLVRALDVLLAPSALLAHLCAPLAWIGGRPVQAREGQEHAARAAQVALEQAVLASAEPQQHSRVKQLADLWPLRAEVSGRPRNDRDRIWLRLAQPQGRSTLRTGDAVVSGDAFIGTVDMEASRLAAQAGGEYAKYTLDVIAERRANPEIDDLIGLLVNSEIEGERLDEEALIHESLLILVGGDETTRHVITGGMLALIQHPEQRQMLLDDPSKIATAIEEMLRWVSPIKNMNRTATRDVELRGQRIRKGDKLLLLYHCANRDERVFKHADRFDIERNPNEHVAFGGYGRHFCLGSSLAKLELRVFFEEVLPRLPDLELAPDAKLELRPSNFIAGLEEMQVRFAQTA